jgi:hypothetical protein
MRTLGFVVAAVLVIIACGGSNASSPSGAASPTESSDSSSSTSCSSDADCALTDHAGCCSCCPEAPSAVTRSALEAQNKKCLAADCAPCPKKQECPKVTSISSVTAKCENGSCTAK